MESQGMGIEALTPDAFHPPMIRLQQASPNPLGRWVLWLLSGLLLFLIIWSLVGRLDIVAVADGKLIPAGYLKIVQPSEAGIVTQILVREGDTVREGQVLMQMDSLITQADLDAVAIELRRKRLMLTRIDAEIEGKPFPIDAEDQALADHVAAQYRANRKAYLATLAEEESRMVKAERELAAAVQQQERLQAVLPYYREQDQAYQKLAHVGFISTIAGNDKQRERVEKEQELAIQAHLIASARASIEQSRKKLLQIQADYVRQLHLERVQTQSEVASLASELEKQSHRRALLALKAPRDGVIKDLATHTVGTVVQPGTVLASLVPQQDALKAEVWVANPDIGFVRPGQAVKLKFATYPFQKYGMGQGTVELISADAKSEDDAANPRSPTAGRQPLQYKVLVALDTNALVMDDVRHTLAAGMQATAEIHLGSRTIAEYLLSPVQKAWSEAARER